jgi:outer membrane protein assembly factor BamB
MTASTPLEHLLFLGTHGHVLALDQRDGALVWKTSLPKTGWAVVILFVEQGRLLCGTAGRAFALDPTDGSILWENELPKMGQGVVAMCTLQQSGGAAGTAAVAAQVAANQATLASTSSVSG